MKYLLAIILLIHNTTFAQTGYQKDAVTADLPAKKIYNYSSPSATLRSLQSNLTIIDFFGTWCVPCIKALPVLADLKNKLGDQLNVVLISTEPAAKLKAFISNRTPFPFPLVADEENVFTNAFMPPAYPYTVLLDKNGRVLTITHAADITEAMLREYLSDEKNIAKNNSIKGSDTMMIPANQSSKITTNVQAVNKSNNALVQLSQNFMYAAKTNEDVAPFMEQLRQLTYEDLLRQIKTDDAKKAFWSNLYNAYTYASLHKNPEQYKNRGKFFGQKNIIIAGKTFNLDKIEHGILRRSKIKWSLGYFNKLFPGKTEKDLRVNELDYRIHFALNCGAKSCPPIAYYNPENINRQLDIATTAYLTGEVEYDSTTNTLELPALMSWFRRDFGGRKKIVALLKTKQLLPAAVNPSISFKKYDWTLYLDNFTN